MIMKTVDDLKKLKYLVLDVDGTLTDSGVIYDENGNELKRFSTKDGQGFNIAHAAGLQIIVMTGRECKATIRRMKELKTDYIFQNVKDKATFLKKFMEDNNIFNSIKELEKGIVRKIMSETSHNEMYSKPSIAQMQIIKYILKFICYIYD